MNIYYVAFLCAFRTLAGHALDNHCALVLALFEAGSVKLHRQIPRAVSVDIKAPITG